MAGYRRARKLVAFLLLFLFLCTAVAYPALAKGFSSEGRSSFSAGKSFSSGRSYSSGGRSFSTRPSATPEAPASVNGGGRDFLSGATKKNGASAPSRESYSTSRESFSTPRQATPPAMYRDYSTERQSYTTGQKSFETGRTSYSGTGFPDTSKTRHPEKPPVAIAGPAPRPPEYYHDYYWDLPLLLRLLFLPRYYWTPWGYHFFAPRLVTWLLLLCLVGILVFYLANRARRQ